MFVVISLGMIMVWGCVYLFITVIGTLAGKHDTDESNTHIITTVIVDIFVIGLLTYGAQTAGFITGVFVCLIFNTLESSAFNSDHMSIKKDIEREDKDHNDNGYIDWNVKK